MKAKDKLNKSMMSGGMKGKPGGTAQALAEKRKDPKSPSRKMDYTQESYKRTPNKGM